MNSHDFWQPEPTKQTLIWKTVANVIPKKFKTLHRVRNEQEKEEWPYHSSAQRKSVPFCSKCFALVDGSEELKLDVRDLLEFILCKTSDNEYSLAVETIVQT